MKLRGLDFLEQPLFLAPMAGVSDIGFRKMASLFGADVTVTEMLSARAMAHNPRKTEYMTITDPSEKLVIAQIFGHESGYMTKALENDILKGFKAYDINMGCPAKKIISNGEGAALMDNVPLAAEIISECRKCTQKPLSVKFRKGYSRQNFVEFGKMCEDNGADFITFHARTVADGYSGNADLEAIAKLKANVKIPVIGNGDITDEKSYLTMLETGVDGVMIGRGALGKPWIFAELNIVKAKKFGLEEKENDKLTQLNKYSVVENHIQTLRSYYDESWLKTYIRKHLLWYAKDLPLASELRLQLATCEQIDAALAVLKDAFKN